MVSGWEEAMKKRLFRGGGRWAPLVKRQRFVLRRMEEDGRALRRTWRFPGKKSGLVSRARENWRR